MEILGQVIAGVVLLIIGYFGRELVRWVRKEKDPATPEEIARARMKVQREHDNEVHLVASEVYDILTVIRQLSSVWRENLVRQHIPDEGFEEATKDVVRRWDAAKTKLAILERDDIPREVEGLVNAFLEGTKALVEDLKPTRTSGPGGRDLRELGGALVGIKCTAESVQSKLDPYRTRLHPPHD